MKQLKHISLLSVLSNVSEKVKNMQINEKLDELKLIDEDQYGFRSEHGTENATNRAIAAEVDEIECARTKLGLNNDITITIMVIVT